jgi:MoaA/NifB/PqqE/SkfB family radical SAM enzyme
VDVKRSLLLEGALRGTPVVGPQSIHIDVTNGCNTNCVTCWDHSPLLRIGRSSAWKRKRVDVETVRALLDDAASLGGLRAVVVSGMGEPFTHPEIDAVLSEVKLRGLHLTVITNLVAADPARILALGVDELLVGVHGASEASYLAFHPSFSAHHWDTLRRMLRELALGGLRAKHVHVICRTNAHELAAMIDQAADLSARLVNFKLASLKDGTEAARASRVDLLAIDQDLDALRARAARREVVTNLDTFALQVKAALARPGETAEVDDAPDQAGPATAPIEEVGCFMGFAYARILVDGTVLYCCNTEVVVGSLAGGDRFSDLWRGATWQAMRDRMRRGDYLASCQQCGKIAQNVKLAERFEREHGRDALLRVTGRAP